APARRRRSSARPSSSTAPTPSPPSSSRSTPPRSPGSRSPTLLTRSPAIHDRGACAVTLPELHLADWRPTKDTLHLYCQIVGKIRLATTPPRNHWWNVPLYVDVRGLTTRRLHH